VAVLIAAEAAVAPSAAPMGGATPRRRLDAESQAWIDRLRGGGHERHVAVGALRALLLGAARFELGRRLGGRSAGEREDLAQQSADDALLAVLRKLGDFRGDSRFTTWAYKFALLEAGVKARRRAWQGREVPLDGDGAPELAAHGATLQHEVEAAEVLTALQAAIATELSPHQRRVLVAVALQDVPIDVLAERLDTTRGALYKTIHDARRKLRTALAAQGLDAGGRTP
jgi:RNA polymerase sigma-70 factor (ECF subfamily)